VETIKPLPFRPDIEGLRGVAILLVVAYHAGVPGFTGGYVGVDVFFVLSGYLITWLLVREIEGTGRLDLTGFYARRARRLLPALALLLFATAVIGYFIYSPSEQHEFARSEFVTAGYVGNLYFAWQRTDYLGADAEMNPLMHTWSLSVEEQFYLFWPILIWLALRSGRRLDGSRTRHERLLWVVTVVLVISFALSVKLTHTLQPWAFYSSPARAWEFAVGGLAALLPIPIRPRIVRIFGWFGFTALIYSALAFNGRTLFPGLAALIPVFGAAVILFAGAKDASAGLNRYLSATWLQGLGRLSYSWYLWHWPVLTFAAAWNGRLTLPARLGWLLLSLGIAAVSYRFVENPIRRSRLLTSRPAYSIVMAVGLTFLGLGVALAWRQVSIRALAVPVQARISKARQDVPNLPENCIASFLQTSVNECSFGNGGASSTIVLFGDSHAAQWFQAVNAVATTEGWRLVTFIKSACAPADISFVYPTLGRRYVECEQWREAALRQIKGMRPNLVIVTGSQWYAMSSNVPPAVTSSDYLGGMKRTFGALNASGAHIVYLWDTPRLGFNIPDCLARAAWQARLRRASSCAFDRQTSLDENVHRLDLQASSGFNVTPVDLTNYICPGNECEPEIGSIIVYRDANHITESFAMSLAPVLRGILKKTLTPISDMNLTN
jgi:peptidoglycan/LPS O-acetylase OafA/YrhL